MEETPDFPDEELLDHEATVDIEPEMADALASAGALHFCLTGASGCGPWLGGGGGGSLPPLLALDLELVDTGGEEEEGKIALKNEDPLGMASFKRSFS